MKKRGWKKLNSKEDITKVADPEKFKSTYPEEKKGVLIAVNFGSGIMEIFSAYHECKVWFITDSFDKCQHKIFRFQHYVTHWQEFPQLPAGYK